jgi:rSAM/selenodomain-associated transferase 2
MNAALSLSSADAEPQREGARGNKLAISIVVPVLNEAPLIVNFLRQLRARAAEAEIIVVDGESSDATTDVAAPLCDQLIRTAAGRARQMNAGAAAAHGEVLWFLHVDVEVPSSCLDDIAACLADPKVAGGFFRIRLPRSALVYRFTDEFAHYAGLMLRMRCGDHGMFSRRSDFFAVGGFPDLLLMEDVEFFRRLRQRGRVVCIAKRIGVDPRRYEAVGPLRVTLAYGLIAALYLLRVPLPLLSRIYARLCCRRD